MQAALFLAETTRFDSFGSKTSMKNKIQRRVPFLVTQGGKAIAGMALYVLELGLPHAVAQGLVLKLADLIAADNAHKQAKVLLKTRRIARDEVVTTVRAFMTVARDVVKPTFGNHYSQVWDAMGLVGSLEIPRTADPLLPVLQSAKGNFTAIPALENAALGVTAALVGTHYDALLAANNGYIQQKDAVNQALVLRNEHAKALERGLRVLLSELHLTLDPLDSRWVSFGFNKPGAKSTPAVPTNVSTVAVGPNGIGVKWEASPRAEYYRVWMKVDGVDQEPKPVGSPADLDFTIENPPVGSVIEISISAVNSGGESARSEVVRVES